MKTEFVQPRFVGARFNEHTLPLEVAKDLAAYETLVVELAKRLYLHEHPERQRVPKGFGADFHLHLESIDEGSAKTILAVVATGVLAFGDGVNGYFEHARDLITECVGSPEGQLPAAFPRDLLVHFNQVGRSLRPDERMEFPKGTADVATLTPDRRKQLVLAADTVYERPIELTGSIVEANWEKSTFQMRLTDSTLAVVPMPESFHPQARNYGGRNRDQVTVCGVGTYDSWDRLQKVVSVESLEVQSDYQLATRFDELRTLKNGWHNGEGITPDMATIDLIAARMIGHFPNNLPIPAIIPTPEGNFLFEWDVPGDPSLDIRLPSLIADFHAFNSDAVDIEQQFNLSSPDEWPRLFAFLPKIISQRMA